MLQAGLAGSRRFPGRPAATRNTLGPDCLPGRVAPLRHQSEARQGRGDEDYSAIARRFLPFVENKGAPDIQPDLFSQPTPPPEQVVPHEEPEFVEQQLAEISATYSMETLPEPMEEAPQTSEPEAEAVPDEPVNYVPNSIEAPLEPAAEATVPTGAEPEMRTRSTEEETEESRGFFRRLLRRTTDY